MVDDPKNGADIVGSTKVLRVLHIIGNLNRGGAETMLVALLKRLQNSEVQSDVCVFTEQKDDYEDEVKSLGCRVVKCKLGKNIFSFMWRLYRLLKKARYDVVDSNMLLFSGICLTVANCSGVPKRVSHLHNTIDTREAGKSTLFRQMYRKIMMAAMSKYATDIVGVSKDVLDFWMGPNWRNNPKVHLRYNGIDTTLYHCQSDPDWLKREFDIPSGYKTVVHVGRFTPQKNHSKVVNVAQSYLAEYRETCFILAGRGPLRNEIEASVKAKGLASNFRFVGSRPDIPRIMKSADAFLFPSAWEGLGVVVVEAVAAGLPMVVSDLPAIREIFDICGSGRLLPADAPDIEWAAALEKAVNTPRQEQWLAELENSALSIEKASETLLSIYRGN